VPVLKTLTFEQICMLELLKYGTMVEMKKTKRSKVLTEFHKWITEDREGNEGHKYEAEIFGFISLCQHQKMGNHLMI
jgi:hypothetical protein